MKKSMKKLFALMIVMLMTVSLLSACGGSSGGGGSEEAAEPNAGVRGVVFTAPDGWTVNGGSEDGYLSLANGDSEFRLSASATSSADLENNKKYDDSITTTDINEHYKKANEEEEKNLKKNNAERSDVTVCGVDGYYYKSKNDKGITNLYTTWILDDNIYYLSFSNPDGYDYETNKYKDDAAVLSDDDVSMYEAVVASAKAGDGEAFMKEALATDSIGAVTFEVPEGYRVASVDPSYLTLRKDGSDADINVSISDKDDLKYMEDENGKHPESIEEEWGKRTEWLEDGDKMEIAGYEGYLQDYPDENGKYYNISAGFLADGEMYDINMFSDAWDENGNLKDDAKELTEEEREAFKTFVKSFKAK